VSGIPRLEAHLADDGSLWFVRCPWCRERHHHALPAGPAACHCPRPGSPYERTGYTGVLADGPEAPVPGDSEEAAA
jgi:hypothetical protein